MPIGAFRLNTLAKSITSTYVSATGGDSITYYDTGSIFYKVHTFTTVGNNNFVVTSGGSADILLVGGGGAGGGTSTLATSNAGGGGAGGFVLYQTGISVSNQTYTISVGAGGTGIAGIGNTGTSSTGLGLTAAGGNGGGGTGGYAGVNGAGAGAGSTVVNTSTAGTYPYKGGDSFYSATVTLRASGGGAGYGGAGVNGTSGVGGNAGIGIQNNIDGQNLYYASGGGGSSGTTAGLAYTNTGTTANSSTSGSGRNTSGAGYPASAATAPYGAGGGGALNTATTSYVGGNGKQGIAIIRYPIETVSSISYINSTNTTTTSITFPTVQAGDIAFYFNNAANTTTTIPTLVAPTGFTNISNTSVGTTLGIRTSSYYKICSGTEGGTSLSGMTGTSSNGIMLVIYRPNIPVNTLIFGTIQQQATDSAPTNQTLAMSGLTGPFIGFTFSTTTFSSGGQGFTVTPTRGIPSVSGNIRCLHTYEATDSSVTFSDSVTSRNDGGTNSLLTFTVKVR